MGGCGISCLLVRDHNIVPTLSVVVIVFTTNVGPQLCALPLKRVWV